MGRARNLALITPTEKDKQIAPGKIAAHSRKKFAGVTKSVAANKIRHDVRMMSVAGKTKAASALRKLLDKPPIMHAAIPTTKRGQSAKMKFIKTPNFAGGLPKQ